MSFYARSVVAEATGLMIALTQSRKKRRGNHEGAVSLQRKEADFHGFLVFPRCKAGREVKPRSSNFRGSKLNPGISFYPYTCLPDGIPGKRAKSFSQRVCRAWSTLHAVPPYRPGMWGLVTPTYPALFYSRSHVAARGLKSDTGWDLILSGTCWVQAGTG